MVEKFGNVGGLLRILIYFISGQPPPPLSPNQSLGTSIELFSFTIWVGNSKLM